MSQKPDLWRLYTTPPDPDCATAARGIRALVLTLPADQQAEFDRHVKFLRAYAEQHGPFAASAMSMVSAEILGGIRA